MSGGERILLVDDDRAFRLSTAELLRQEGYVVRTAADAQEGVDALRAGTFDLLLLDLRMPGASGLEVVEALRRWGEGIPVMMISGFGTIDSAVEALHLGADDFVTKPVDPEELARRVAEILERHPRSAGGGRPEGAEIVGRSAAMTPVFDAIRKVAPTDSTVLLTGETGTGKELVARAIHGSSGRAGGPFIAVSCAAISPGLLESELFGHTRGAFTGAVREKRGLFEAASGGTIFLDEVGDMELALQRRLLRVLQEREIRPVGAVRTIPIDVRVIAATNRDLRGEVEAGTFREDLFYRLNVFAIQLPPLRERSEDIPLLAAAAIRRLTAVESDDAARRFSPFAMRMLRAYDWPGNVRELFSVVESAAIRAGDARIGAQHLPAEIRAAVGEDDTAVPDGERYSREGDAEEERAAIIAALEETGGVRSRAAELLGMGRTTLWRKMKRYGLDPEE